MQSVMGFQQGQEWLLSPQKPDHGLGNTFQENHLSISKSECRLVRWQRGLLKSVQVYSSSRFLSHSPCEKGDLVQSFPQSRVNTDFRQDCLGLCSVRSRKPPRTSHRSLLQSVTVLEVMTVFFISSWNFPSFNLWSLPSHLSNLSKRLYLLSSLLLGVEMLSGIP